MTYIHFTEEQKYRASCVDLVEFLRRQGEKLIRSGPEYRMASDHSVTVRGNDGTTMRPRRAAAPSPLCRIIVDSAIRRRSPVCWKVNRGRSMNRRPGREKNRRRNSSSRQ